MSSVQSSGLGISIAGIQVTYGLGSAQAVQALAPVDLEVADGAFVSLVGPSGCGKSTLLKVLADLMPPTQGQVLINGLPPSALRQAGRIGLVFQQANLMPWLTVEKNVKLLKELVQAKSKVASARVIRCFNFIFYNFKGQFLWEQISSHHHHFL